MCFELILLKQRKLNSKRDEGHLWKVLESSAVQVFHGGVQDGQAIELPQLLKVPGETTGAAGGE